MQGRSMYAGGRAGKPVGWTFSTLRSPSVQSYEVNLEIWEYWRTFSVSLSFALMLPSG